VKILVACIGNIFLGDDAFGVEMARHLEERIASDRVCVVDYGIRGYDLAYALTEGYDAAILVDAASRGQAPGTLYIIRPDSHAGVEAGAPSLDAHSLNPMAVLRMAASTGGVLPPVFVVGCEPKVLETPDGEFGLSPEVAAAVPRAVEMVDRLVGSLLKTLIPSSAGLVPAT
jgi:hydrogenase maturation protease